MKKRIFIFVFIWILTCSLAYGLRGGVGDQIILTPLEQARMDSLIEEAVDELFENFIYRVNRETDLNRTEDNYDIGIKHFQGDINNTAFNRFESRISNHTDLSRFTVHELEDTDVHSKELSRQEQDMYERSDDRLGRYKQFDWLIRGRIIIISDNILGKRRIYLSAVARFSHIEVGEVLWTTGYSTIYKSQFPFRYYLFGIGIVAGLIFGFNTVSKGRCVSLVAGGGLIMSVLFTIWFFVI